MDSRSISDGEARERREIGLQRRRERERRRRAEETAEQRAANATGIVALLEVLNKGRHG